MNHGSARRPRRFVPSARSVLEPRVVMSTIGQAAATAPPSGADPAPLRHALVEVGSVEARSAVRAENHHSGHSGSPNVAPTSDRWAWFANTYWYVPVTNLPAVLSNSATGSVLPVSDQTVFHVTNYAHGYFWGTSVTQLGSSSPSATSMLGSVTPEGRVLLTFTQTSTNSSPSITEGFGQTRRKFGQWTMENQMFTAPGDTLQIGHWAYMVQTRPGLASWSSLPSVGVSVPEFLNE